MKILWGYQSETGTYAGWKRALQRSSLKEPLIESAPNFRIQMIR